MKRCIGLVLAALVLLLLTLPLLQAGETAVEKDRQLLTDALRRTAATCYAVEGFYPPDVAYMQQHYGLQYNESRFQIIYERFASNLMPDITVLDKTL